ncbi:MAG: sugar ABC transporter ATP-binding protein [Ignavibacteriae bacterium]|nr:sugar ABC transporter ATP-binding protein [Ignavibacteriota bacterium]
MQGIGKSYPGVRALDDVHIDLYAGEIHCLVGENGAGKSTLMGILSGGIVRTAGSIRFEGREASIDSPAASQRLGIGMIHQESRLVPALSVAENMLLGDEPRSAGFFIDRSVLRTRARAALELLGEEFDPDCPVERLGSAERQIVEIAKALTRDLRVLVLDEPTAALTEREKTRLFGILRALREKGTGIFYISHRLEEIFEIGDRITVLRDGRVVAGSAVADADRPRLIRWMVGRDIEQEYPKESVEAGAELLVLDTVSTATLRDISFTLKEGEVLGVAGLIGSGKLELSRLLYGVEPGLSGSMTLGGRSYAPRTPAAALQAGLALLTEDRNTLGVFPNLPVRANITISTLTRHVRGRLLRASLEDAAARAASERYRIKPSDIESPVTALSGGNRQKVVLARAMETEARVLVFHEPTAGVDVGAKFEIYTHIVSLARAGKGVVMISSDLPELLGMCDRVLVLSRGRVAGTLERAEATQETVMALATRTFEDGRT